MIPVWGALFVLTAAVGAAFRPELAGSMTFWWLLFVPHAAIGAYAGYALHRAGRLGPLLRPRFGDLTLGALVGVILLVASWAGRETLAEAGTPRQAWLFNIYLQVGDPRDVEESWLITSLVLAIVVAEDVIWRGWALERATTVFGERRGWPITTVLYAVTMVPTVFTLAAPTAGPNPLLCTAALFCGLVWTFMAHLTGRLPPVIMSHAIFTYFSIVQFRQPGL